MSGIAFLATSGTGAKGELFGVRKVTEPNSSLVYQIQCWPSTSDFIADSRTTTQGTRPVTDSTELFTAAPNGDLFTLQVASWDKSKIEVYRYRDAYDFCRNKHTIMGVVAPGATLTGVTFDGQGRFYAIDETLEAGNLRSYRVRMWASIEAFIGNAGTTTLGTRTGSQRHSGLEFVGGKLISLEEKFQAGEFLYEVWDWGSSFSGFINNVGTLRGARASNSEWVAIFSTTHSTLNPETTVARRPVWPWLGNRFPDSVPGSRGGWNAVNAFPDLTFEDPVQMVPEPGSNRLWVIGRQGHIWSFENNPSTSNKTLALDISAVTLRATDSGLLGIAFHPEFGQPASSNRGYVYLWYNFRPIGGDAKFPLNFNRLSRFKIEDGAAVIDPASEFVLINQFDEHEWHNGGGMHFGADGFLYISVGDEGGADDQYQNAQKINGGLFSGVLRIDVDRNPARSHPVRRQPQDGGTPPIGWGGSYTQGYFVPNDNPWVEPGGSVLEEFWAVGLRSPHRMTFDPISGTAFIGDIGQATREEVDILAKGANYQWAYREGSTLGPKAMPEYIVGTDARPIWSYPRHQGDSCVIGGYVYRGAIHSADLGGKYIFGDHVSGRIWSMNWEAGQTPTVEQLTSITGSTLTGFGLDHANEFYLLSLGKQGRLLKLVQAETPQPPATLGATGAFSDLQTLIPAQEMIPYEVNSPLWSDNATKQRWIVLPNNGAPFSANEVVSFQAESEWQYPAGTVLIKHFELPTNDASPGIRKRLETRFMVKTNQGEWYGVTYKWREDGSEADLLDAGQTEKITITTADGGTRTQTWSYPSRNECTNCHRPESTQVLSLRTWQLNGNTAYPGTTTHENQLRVWSDIGMFDQTLSPGQIAGFLRSAPLSDVAATPETRMRSYLDANCAHCHRPGGVPALFDARFSTPLPQQNILNGPLNNLLGIPGARSITPGSVDQSMIDVRMASENTATQMPPMGRAIVHAQALRVLEDWINNLIPPNTPSALTAVPTDYGTLTLTWNFQSTNQNSCIVQHSADGSSWATLATLGADAVSYRDSGRPHGVTSYYRIAAANAAGISSWSATASGITWPERGSWQDWQRLHPLGGQNGALQNPDGDSASNLIEFAFGGDAENGGNSQGGFALTADGHGGISALIITPRDLRGVTITLVGSPVLTDPSSWAALPSEPDFTINPDGTLTARVDGLNAHSLFASTGQGFVRVAVRLDANGQTAYSDSWFWDTHTFAQGSRSLGPVMLKPERFSGTVSSGSTALTLVGNTGGAGILSHFDPSRKAYVEITSGTFVGHRFEIDVAATTNGTLALDAGSLHNTQTQIPDLTGATFVAREHWTLGEIFPISQWQGASSPAAADRVQFYDPKVGWIVHWLLDINGKRTWVAQGDATLTDQGNRVIAPGVGVFIRKLSPTTAVPLAGVLRTNPFRLRAPAGISLVAPGFPLVESPISRFMVATSGFVSGRSSAKADQFLRWAPDHEPLAPDGYATHFLLSVGSNSFWTPTANATLPDQSASPLFLRQKAVFLRLLGDRSDWVQPIPWAP